MTTKEYLLYGAIGYGLYCLLSGGKSEAEARASQENVMLPKISPMGDAPRRTADNPLSDDEKQALQSGAAYMDANGWLKYAGYGDKDASADGSSSGTVTW